jgi:hypothetical protein
LFWDNVSAFSTLSLLLLEEFAASCGVEVKARTGKMRRLQDCFGMFKD